MFHRSIVKMAAKGDLDGVKNKIARGKDVNTKDHVSNVLNNLHAHHHDCLVNHISIVYQEGRTALLRASDKGHMDIAKYLVDMKAGLDIQNKVSICCVHAQMYVCLYLYLYVCM